MIQADQLMGVAYDLAKRGKNPTQEHLRRSVSTIYYAMFHTLCRLNADSLVGPKYTNAPAWVKVYRALDHGVAKRKCETVHKHGFESQVVGFAKRFCQLQSRRHRADYDPIEIVKYGEVLYDLLVTGFYINNLYSIGKERLRDFAVYLLFEDRKK